MLIGEKDSLNTGRIKLNSWKEQLDAISSKLSILVAQGHLTDKQFLDLMTAVNGFVKKGDISVLDINLNLGKIGLEYLSDEVIAAMTGNTSVGATITDGSVTTIKVADNAITPEKTTLFEVTKNLWDGKYYDWFVYDYTNTDGSKEAYINKNYSGTQYTAIIPVVPGQPYTIKIHDKEKSNAFTIATSAAYPSFDSSGIYKTGLPVNKQGLYTVPDRTWTITIPSNHKYLYVLAAQNQTPPSKMQVEAGAAATSFTSHLAIKQSYLPSSIASSITIDSNKIDRLVPEILTSKDMYNVPQLNSVNGVGAEKQIHELKTADMYALYDELMNQSSTYMTKSVFTTETKGKTIYQYSLQPETPKIMNSATTKKLPKIFVMSGVHGSEKASWYCTYEMIKQIIQNWKNSRVLEYLRWNVEIILIPMLNVYGIDNISDPVTYNGKINANGVDINRNYPSNWAASEPGTIGYGGTAPLTEPESKAVYNYITSNDVDFIIDYHNFSSQIEPVFMWSVVNNEKMMSLSLDYFRHLSNKWKISDNNFPQSNDIFFGQAGTATAGGSLPYLADELFIPGGIFEICHTMWPKNNQTQYSSEVITLGTEAQLNWLYLAAKSLSN
ncbi:M14 family metallopeptidase [Macrococcoides canis]|uniref:M14 family metallopeptidase n=1 Tax=Macrococcoides canis TaxID=1855823 RepID=UPI00165E85FB|nr:M14 family metallopeptidase [Macrococcus canis]QNR08231.1 hypothetical protein GL258_08150 [Macrococcus canis]